MSRIKGEPIYQSTLIKIYILFKWNIDTGYFTGNGRNFCVYGPFVGLCTWSIFTMAKSGSNLCVCANYHFHSHTFRKELRIIWLARTKLKTIISDLIQIPETPIFLMSKDRPEKAMKSLQWLRGCVSPEDVKEEHQQLREYSIQSKTCEKCSKQSIECSHLDTFQDRFKQLSTKRVIKPFILVFAAQFFLQFCAVNSSRAYSIQILNAYNIQWNANLAAIVMSAFGFVGRLTLLPILKAFGKRKIYLFSSIATALCGFGLSWIHILFCLSNQKI